MKGLRLGLLVTFLSCMALPSWAQSVPDRSLGGESTRLVREGSIEYVEGGAVRGDALFHSFEDLRVGRGRGLYFRAGEVDRIFSRVTGDRQSRIDGTLGAIGDADLYLINPNGIVFGPDARLDIGGSFVASTASSFTFPDYEYGVDDWEDVPPLLTIRDWGLRLDRPAQIRVLGSGHVIEYVDSRSFNPLVGAGLGEVGLSVPSGNSLSFVAGEIDLSGATLTASSGTVNLVSLRFGEVNVEDLHSIDMTSQSLELGQVHIRDNSLIDVSGVSMGGDSSISVTAERTFILQGSHLLSQNIGFGAGSDIRLNSRGVWIDAFQKEVDAISRESEAIAGILNSTVLGEAGDITINSEYLNLSNGGFISNISYGTADSGDIRINTDSLQVVGNSNTSRVFDPSNIQNLSVGAGNSGDILINAGVVQVQDGGTINTNTLSTPPFISQSGNIEVYADSIYLDGRNDANRIPSSIQTSSAFQGSSGDLSIHSTNLGIYNGAFLGSLSFGFGSPGGVNISSQDILIDGFSNIDTVLFDSTQRRLSSFDLNLRAPADIEFDNFSNPSHLRRSLIASLFIPDIERVNENEVVFNDAGKYIILNAETLKISNSAFISAVNAAAGDAGNIILDVDKLILDRGGISSDLIVEGQGGVIDISSDSLYAIDRSLLSASASGTSNGGNLSVTAGNVVLIDSVLRANGQLGFGGQVRLTTDSFFEDSSLLEATSDLSSSLDGTVEVDFSRSFPDQDLLPSLKPGQVQDSVREACISSGRRANSLRLGLRRSRASFDGFRNTSQLWRPGNSVHGRITSSGELTEASDILVEDDGTTHLVSASPRRVFLLSSAC